MCGGMVSWNISGALAAVVEYFICLNLIDILELLLH